MGGNLMRDGLIYGSQAKLSNAAMLVVWAMAAHAWDAPTDNVQPGIYFGGWKVACYAIGWPADETGRTRYSRAIRELVHAGLIVPDGQNGRQRRWRLTWWHPY